MSDHVESDIGAAAFLAVSGYSLIGLARLSPARYGFDFADPHNTATEARQSYFAGATAEAKALLEALYDLEDRQNAHIAEDRKLGRRSSRMMSERK